MHINVDAVNPGEHRLTQAGLAGDDPAELAGHPRASRVVADHGFIKAPEILALLCQLDADAVVDRLTTRGRPEVPGTVLVPTLKADRYERRVARRIGRSGLRPDLQLTMRGGPRAELINLSETGVLVEVSTHAVIGSVVDIFIRVDQHCHVVRAKTVRSNVVAIESGSVVYHTAFQFEERLSLRHLLRN